MKMMRLNEESGTVEEQAEVYFNDHRVKRILKSMWSINSAIALPSLVLLIPVRIDIPVTKISV